VTDNSNLVSIRNQLFSDIDREQEYYNQKPLLAHYCTVDTVEKILKGGEIWLSCPLLMNDIEEVRFGILNSAVLFSRLVANTASERESKIIRVVADELEKLHFDFNQLDAMDVYALCLSRHEPDDNDGLLSMWRGYGENGKGVALVFDTAKFPVVDGSPFILAEVHYASNHDRLKWLENKIAKFAQELFGSELSDSDLKEAARLFYERIKLFSIFSKHAGFGEEREWRLVYIKTRDKQEKHKINLSYWVGPKGIEPKLKLKLSEVLPSTDLSGGEAIIDRIILGPTSSSHLSKAAFARMLHLTGRSSLISKTQASTIPYRP
jgi:hypothetical protein